MSVRPEPDTATHVRTTNSKEQPMQEHIEPSAGARRWWTRGAAALFIAAMAALAVLNLPRGFDADLGKIGAGKPALVFVYDPNLVVSNKQTREMDEARKGRADALHFLVADVGRPDTQQFMRQHQAAPTQLLLFAGDGRLLQRTQSLMTAEELLQLFDQSIAP
jgi:hypothetical protein